MHGAFAILEKKLFNAWNEEKKMINQVFSIEIKSFLLQVNNVYFRGIVQEFLYAQKFVKLNTKLVVKYSFFCVDHNVIFVIMKIRFLCQNNLMSNFRDYVDF